ncbi:MAG: sensor histidine kinase, partial [Myxococcota bacterium]
LVVKNDGRTPANRDRGSGFGILGMKERAALLGGSFRAGPAPDGGWSVVATLPRGAHP